MAGGSYANGRSDSVVNGRTALAMSCGPGVARFSPHVVVTHLVKLACALPDEARRSLSLWTCAELAHTLVRDGVVESISPQSVQRILSSHRLKPWRVHYWLSAKVPRDEAFLRQRTRSASSTLGSWSHTSGSFVSMRRPRCNRAPERRRRSRQNHRTFR